MYSSDSLNENDTVYMLMTDRFFDGDPSNNGVLGEEYRPGNLHYYQGGDWVGITQKLPYIKNLGFSAIWMSAPQKNEKYSRSRDEAGYHGYYTKDFNSPNPHFGTEEELKALVASANDLGIKVIIDAQLNHTADYLEYPSTTYSSPDYQPAAPFNNPSWYHNTPNIVNFDDPYEAQNYSLGGLDDLAQENPECWQALMDAYWKPSTNSGWFSYGFAGSRIDAVIQIPPQYLALYEQHTEKPSFGEAFTGSVDENAAFQDYIWGMLDFPLYFQMNNVFCKGEDWGGVKWVFEQDYKYRNTKRLFTFIDNHDRARFLANSGDNWQKMRLALVFQYTVRGIPIVYYGTEQNLAGDFRYTEETINYWNREMMKSFDQNTVTFRYIQRLNELRAEYANVFVEGVQQELYYSCGDPVYSFSRRNLEDGEEIICIFNNSAVEQSRSITLHPEKTGLMIGTYLTDLLETDRIIAVQDGQEQKREQNSRVLNVTIPPNSAVLLAGGCLEEYHQPDYFRTKVIIRYDVGFGNTLYIRGNCTPLNWHFGQKCENVDASTWQFVMERPVSGDIGFKILINDSIWELGNDHIVQAGNTITISPVFKH